MAEYITKEQVLEWFRPYGHTDEPIPFETLATDLRDCIPAADVAPVRHGRWFFKSPNGWACSQCGEWGLMIDNRGICKSSYCPNCGAKMDQEEQT